MAPTEQPLDYAADYAAIARLLVGWHNAHQRDLPWRTSPAGARDPYAVWISEVMLQQTRVEAVVGYYNRWMKRFPTVDALAAANLQDVLKAWEGLGYYARARNLHRAAIHIVGEFGGVFPAERSALLALPGIGEYTVGALLSIAYNQPEPLLDGNVKRVLARLLDLDQPINHPSVLKLLWQHARALVAAAAPGEAGACNEGHHGAGRHDLHAAEPALPAVPVTGPVRRCRPRHPGRPARHAPA